VLTGEEAVDSFNRRFGYHPGRRTLHAKGVIYQGTFTATPAAAEMTRAAHMQGQPVDVTVRVSNGSGDPAAPDYAPDVRGLATRFHLPDGARTDILSQTSPRFPSKTAEDFLAFVDVTKPSPAQLLRLPLFLATRPAALRSIKAGLVTLKNPASYATLNYYAIHAFRWVDAGGGTRYVRYTWVPEAGEQFISRGDAKKRGRDYLVEEIAERVAAGPVRFTLSLQVAGEGDRTDDPTVSWPDSRERIEAGTLELKAPDTEHDDIVFDPMFLTDGIEASEDAVLNFRPHAYKASYERRTA
jgi:catalase